MSNRKLPIGDLLVQNGLITADQLIKALAEQKARGGKLGEVLIKLAYLAENDFLQFLATQLKIPFIDLPAYPLKSETVQQLQETMARNFHAILLEKSAERILVGMAEPQDIVAYDQLSKYFKQPIDIALVRESELQHTYNIFYRRTQAISSFAEELSEELNLTPEVNINKGFGEPTDNDATVSKLLRSILEDAALMGASDIHIEPGEHELLIRQRIDGVLQEQVIKETHIAKALTQRLKMMAQLNITEKRLPQDGHFNIKIKHLNLDVRLSTLPVQYGESIVLRLLDNNIAKLQLDKLGLPGSLLETMNRLTELPHGMILVTGPTGSGKTTTLYSLLNKLNTASRKIITVEDPVEYHLPRINQVQVNATIELTFARVLRAALRQDPDIIMVGEIRDKETSSIALRAALTGHLVLATLHTNDAIGTITRLMELESESYLIGDALRAVIAQRLLRAICEKCQETYEPTAPEKFWLAKHNAEAPATLKRGKGCSRCNNTGYKGRIGAYELIELDSAMADALCRNNLEEFTKITQQKGYLTLSQSAVNLILQGATTIQEVWRVITGS